MSIILDFFGEIFIVVAFAAIFGAWEYIAYRAGKRFWMWVAGLVGIAALIWFKGAAEVWSWMLGLGWLGVLVYFDRRMHPPEPPEASETATGKSKERQSAGRDMRRY